MRDVTEVMIGVVSMRDVESDLGKSFLLVREPISKHDKARSEGGKYNDRCVGNRLVLICRKRVLVWDDPA